MLIETIVTALVVVFVAIAVIGHVLLLAACMPTKARNSSEARVPPSHHAPVPGTRIAA